MKAELLDTEAMLSCAKALLTLPSPDIAAALVDLGEAQDKLLALAEVQEQAEKQTHAAN